jgi:hypothetical protein
MADQFVDALVRHVDGPNPGKTEQERLREKRQTTIGEATESPSDDATTESADSTGDTPEDDAPAFGDDDAGAAFAAAMDAVDERDDEPVDADAAGAKADAAAAAADEKESPDRDTDSGFSAEEVLSRLSAVSETPTGSATTDGGARVDAGPNANVPTGAGPDESKPPSEMDELAVPDIVDGETNRPVDEGDDASDEDDIIDGDESAPSEFREGITGGGASEYDIIDGEDDLDEGEEPLVVRELKADIAGMETKARKMLNFYREFGPGTPLNAHFAAGGDGDRTKAYAHNRTLRTRGLIEHVGRGRYDYRLRDLLDSEFDGHVDDDLLEQFAVNVETKTLDGATVDDETSE